jgi:hypothetical protein
MLLGREFLKVGKNIIRQFNITFYFQQINDATYRDTEY